MIKKLPIVILDIGLILLAYSTLIYFKLEKGEYKSTFRNYDLLSWMPYVGGMFAVIGFVLILQSRKVKPSI